MFCLNSIKLLSNNCCSEQQLTLQHVFYNKNITSCFAVVCLLRTECLGFSNYMKSLRSKSYTHRLLCTCTADTTNFVVTEMGEKLLFREREESSEARMCRREAVKKVEKYQGWVLKLR